MTSLDSLPRLRKMCLALPEVTERISHGEPSWFVRGKKLFVTFVNHHHDDRVGFWCAAPEGAQEMLVLGDPRRFFRPPYVGHRGWLGVYLDLDEPPEWSLIADLVVEAYRCVAPARLLAELAAKSEERGGGSEPAPTRAVRGRGRSRVEPRGPAKRRR